MPYGPGTYGSKKGRPKKKKKDTKKKKMMYGGRVKKNDGGELKNHTKKALSNLPEKDSN